MIVKRDIVYREQYPYLKLTKDEYFKLAEMYGKKEAANLCVELDMYIGSIGDKYKNHYMVLRTWARKKNLPDMSRVVVVNGEIERKGCQYCSDDPGWIEFYSLETGYIPNYCECVCQLKEMGASDERLTKRLLFIEELIKRKQLKKDEQAEGYVPY
jgi:hypothetical protein